MSREHHPFIFNHYRVGQATFCTCGGFKGHKEVTPGSSVDVNSEIEKQVKRLFPKCAEHKMCPSTRPHYRLRSSTPYLLICLHSQQHFEVSCRETVQYCLSSDLASLLLEGHLSYDKLEGRVLAVGEHATDEEIAERSLLAILIEVTPQQTPGTNTEADGEVIKFDKVITAHDILRWELRCSGCALLRPDGKLKDLHNTSVQCKLCPAFYPHSDALYHHHQAKHHDSVFDGLEGYPHSCSICERDSSARHEFDLNNLSRFYCCFCGSQQDDEQAFDVHLKSPEHIRKVGV